MAGHVACQESAIIVPCIDRDDPALSKLCADTKQQKDQTILNNNAILVQRENSYYGTICVQN